MKKRALTSTTEKKLNKEKKIDAHERRKKNVTPRLSPTRVKKIDSPPHTQTHTQSVLVINFTNEHLRAHSFYF